MTQYTNINMRRSNLPLDGTFAPGQGSREKWAYKDNISPSVQDPVFQKQREDKETVLKAQVEAGQITKAKANKELKKPLVIDLETQEDVAIATDKVARLKFSRQALTDRMDQRIAAFLTQIIDCYDTDYHFTVGHTETQTESAPPINFKLPQGAVLPLGGTLSIPQAATHQGTIPCIWAYNRNEWTQWKVIANGNAKAAGKPAPIVYHKMADPYLANNACAGLDKTINDPADITLDGNRNEQQIEFPGKNRIKEKKLRELSIDLLNRAARKEITPIEGFTLYMTHLEELVNSLADSITDADEKAVFVAWKQDLGTLQAEYKGNYKLLIARLLHFNIPEPERDSINLEYMVFPRHFKLLQKKYCYQSHLAKKIDDLKTAIHVLDGNKKRKNFDKALKVELIAHAQKQDKKVYEMFQRFYNLSAENHLNLELECRQTAKPALAAVRTDNAQKAIKNFFKDFNTHVNDMRIEESSFNTGLMKEVREARGFSLRKFAEVYNEKYPREHTLNHEQYRRIENGCVEISPKQINQFAEVLSIPNKVLRPQVLT